MRMWWWGQEAAKDAKIAVWWNMKDCPIPEGYDAGRVRPSIEEAVKKQGYSGPVVSFTAYGDQTQTLGHILKELFSTGVSVAHTRSESTAYVMYRDIVEWRGQNPPPASLMIISDQVGVGDLPWDLTRLQQRAQYNLFLAYSKEPNCIKHLLTSGQWEWKHLLVGSLEDSYNNRIETSRIELSQSTMLCCKSCNFECQSPEKFRKHLSSYKHARQEYVYPMRDEPAIVTETWGRNYNAASPELSPEFATAKIRVLWDMFDCPIPEGYDARRLRPSLKAAFKKLGYSGPVSITAYGDFNRTPDHLLRGLSSTGVNLAHNIYAVAYKRIYEDLFDEQEHDPTTPTNIMVISHTQEFFETPIVCRLQRQKHNLFLAYSFRPIKMLNLLTSAEWLWHSLLEEEVSENRKHFLQKCSESESESEPSAMFYCKLCFYDCDWEGPDYSRLDDFRTHLLTEEHAQEEYKITSFHDLKMKNRHLSQLAHYDRTHREQWLQAKSKRTRKALTGIRRKAFPMTGIRLLDYHLRRGGRPKARTCKKE